LLDRREYGVESEWILPEILAQRDLDYVVQFEQCALEEYSNSNSSSFPAYLQALAVGADVGDSSQDSPSNVVDGDLSLDSSPIPVVQPLTVAFAEIRTAPS